MTVRAMLSTTGLCRWMRLAISLTHASRHLAAVQLLPAAAWPQNGEATSLPSACIAKLVGHASNAESFSECSSLQKPLLT